MGRMRKPESRPAGEWLACDDPSRLFERLGEGVSDRKFILYALAGCYASSAGVAEAWARWETIELAADRAEQRQHWGAGFHPRAWAESWARRHDWSVPDPPREVLAALVRCVFGDRFWPAVFGPAWRTDTALAMAAGIYAEKAFGRLPVLADALEDAGCDDPDVLGHCRLPGPHARGCWVVDLVLGKV